MKDYSKENANLLDAIHIDPAHQRFNVAYSRYTHDSRCHASFQYAVNLLTGTLPNQKRASGASRDLLPAPKEIAKYVCDLAQAMHEEHKERGWHHPVIVEPLKEERTGFGFGGGDEQQ